MAGFLDLLEDDGVNGPEFFPDLFVSGRVKEEDADAQDAVEQRERSVQAGILEQSRISRIRFMLNILNTASLSIYLVRRGFKFLHQTI